MIGEASQPDLDLSEFEGLFDGLAGAERLIEANTERNCCSVFDVPVHADHVFDVTRDGHE